jgi:tRNA (cytosine40_48-C5)-methyltransferase
MHPLTQRYTELCPGFALAKTVRPALRVNTLKVDEKSLVQRLKGKNVALEKIPFVRHGYWYESTFSLGATPEYLQGYYFLQEAASQIPADLLDPQPGETVLDMACAPGGKLTQLAAFMQGTGVLIGMDTDERRLLATRNNAARLGITNAILYKKDGRQAKELGMVFDRVLLDAPCSGNYVVEKGWFEKRHVTDFTNRAALQKELLRAGFTVLKKDGVLVYSTCSLEPEEDEMVVDWVVKELGAVVEKTSLTVGDPGITTVFGKALDPSVGYARRFWPFKTGTQGFFVAKLRRDS